MLVDAEVISPYLARATRFELRDQTDAAIPPGGSLLAFNIIPLLSEEESYADWLKVILLSHRRVNLKETFFIVTVAQSDGAEEVFVYRLQQDELADLLRRNADRCSAVGEKNNANGCIGTNVPQEERDPYADFFD